MSIFSILTSSAYDSEVYQGFVGLSLISSPISFALPVALYVISSLGLYTIANRRGIQNAWLAWLPIGSMWVLASIADHYRRTVRGEQKNRRTLLVILTAVIFVLALVLIGNLVQGIFQFAVDMNDMYLDSNYSTPEDTINRSFATLLSSAGLVFIIFVCTIVVMVFQFICLYELFASCDPDNKTIFLLLSIFLNISGILVFICRNKDAGMHPPAQPNYNQQYYGQNGYDF